jgi:hypothetical protein
MDPGVTVIVGRLEVTEALATDAEMVVAVPEVVPVNSAE